MNYNPINLLEKTNDLMFLIDRDYEIRFSNRERGVGNLCYKQLWNLEEPCKDCRINALFDEKASFSKNGSRQINGESIPVACQYEPYEEYALCVIKDRTGILNILKEVKGTMDALQGDLQKRKAEQVISKHKLKAAQRQEKLLESYHDCLSSGVMVIDREFNIVFNNEKMWDLGPLLFGPAPTEPKTCFQWIYREDHICQDCPLQKNPDFIGKHTRLVDHGKTRAFITENFGQTGNHVVLTVSDSTRAIDLAKNIKVQQNEIEALNRILREVLAFGNVLQRLDSEELIFKLTLNQIQKVFFDTETIPSGFILLHPSNRNPEFAVFHGLSKDQEKELFAGYLHSGIKTFEDKKYTVMDIESGKNSGKGYFFVQTEPFEEKIQNIFKILLNMIGALLENLVLMRSLEKKASVDGLTGVFNRAYFQQCFDIEKKKAEKINLPFSLIVIDINGLKEVNDVFGHEGGDTLIVSCGRLLNELVREEDVVARYGGDEYVVLLPATGRAGLESLLERFREHQHTSTFELHDKHGKIIRKPLRFSLGGASSDEDKFDNIFQIADQRMYDDKEKYYQTHQRYR